MRCKERIDEIIHGKGGTYKDFRFEIRDGDGKSRIEGEDVMKHDKSYLYVMRKHGVVQIPYHRVLAIFYVWENAPIWVKKFPQHYEGDNDESNVPRC